MPSTKRCPQFAATGTCPYDENCRFLHDETPDAAARPKGRTRKIKKSQESNHLNDFFSEFILFNYNPAQPATEEFHRLSRLYGWNRDKTAEVREEFKNAMVKVFNDIYGTNENDINSWYGLCNVLNITPLPDTLNGCREKVRDTHVNLVDLVDLPNSNEPIHIFPTELALSEYTKDTHKIFPRENAYAGGLLKFLLRKINNPPLHASRARRRRKR